MVVENGAETRSMEGISAVSLSESSSSVQVENGSEFSELYRTFTWEVGRFSQITSPVCQSDLCDVGGCKWYMSMCREHGGLNYLSFFLCIHGYSKFRPGWSYFAQFTITVVNKDSRKSKHFDALHQFCEKERHWGWKDMLVQSELTDGFLVDNALTIKGRIQVIRLRDIVDRPFRCISFRYRRELVRIYLSNIEQTCMRFIGNRRDKLSKLTNDKDFWTWFSAFWLEIDAASRWQMLRVKIDMVLKVVVNHFFVKNEVTSTLFMDLLYSGLKYLENQSKNKRGEIVKTGLLRSIAYVDEDMFVLSDDVFTLLEWAVSQPWARDENAGELANNIDSFDRDDRRLTELGQRTLEFFVLTHIVSRIEFAYREDVALRVQEELMLAEESAVPGDHLVKDKRSKKKKKKNNQKRKEPAVVMIEPENKPEEFSHDTPKSIESELDEAIIEETRESMAEPADIPTVVSHDALQPMGLDLVERDKRDSSPLNRETHDVSKSVEQGDSALGTTATDFGYDPASGTNTTHTSQKPESSNTRDDQWRNDGRGPNSSIEFPHLDEINDLLDGDGRADEMDDLLRRAHEYVMYDFEGW